MVHADASNFKEGLTKEEAYTQVFEQAEALFEGQRNWVCNLANAASLLWHAYASLPAPAASVNWAGFYVLDRVHNGPRRQLILGPFMGKVACQTIAFGKGVCGTVAQNGRSEVVRDVEEWPGHIACDSQSRSEVVVPVFTKSDALKGEEQLVAVIDVDCAEVEGFDETDRKWLEKLAELLGRSCDFQP